MGYADFGNFKLLDGYAVTTTASAPISTNWVDVHSAPFFDVTVVFTGGAPTGTLKLQKSNNLQNTGGNRPQPNMAGNGNSVDDTIDVPSGNGHQTATVTAAGTYAMDQNLIGYRWFRVVFTPTNNVSTTIDAFVNWKKG